MDVAELTKFMKADPNTKPKAKPPSIFIGTPEPSRQGGSANAPNLTGFPINPDTAQVPATQAVPQESQTVLELMRMMAVMQETINDLRKDKNKAAQEEQDKIPTINHKDIEKPSRYDGKGWTTWNDDFKNFLGRRDARWKSLLEEIQRKEYVTSPLTDTKQLEIADAVKLSNVASKAFKEQLYEYLRNYTAGETLAVVQASGASASWEVWRRLSDQGRSLRDRPLREEHRALYHPKQCADGGAHEGHRGLGITPPDISGGDPP